MLLRKNAQKREMRMEVESLKKKCHEIIEENQGKELQSVQGLAVNT